MKVSALIAAALLVVSVSAKADHHEEKGAGTMAPAAKAAKAAKAGKATTTTTTTTTTATAPAEGAMAPAAHAGHADCTTLKGKAKTSCEALEKTAHANEGAAHSTH